MLQADAYSGFDELYVDGRILEAGWRAHVRRKFYDFHEAKGSPVAAEALRRIGELYAIEADIRGRLPEERARERATRAGPLLESSKSGSRDSSREYRRSPSSRSRSATRFHLGLH